ncbi:hypothetical protein M9458_009108, partial [Cirrhinus mrigala]
MQVLTVSSSVPLRVSAALKAGGFTGEGETFDQHFAAASAGIGQVLGQLDTLERHMKYLQCLARIEELSDSIQQYLMTNSVQNGLSGYGHLQAFLRETLRFWHKILKDKLTSDFEEVLTQFHWPFISPPTQTLSPPANAQELNSQLDLL